MTAITDFDLPNVTAGPDPFQLRAYATADARNAIVLLLLRDYHCPKCQAQVETIASRYEEFESRHAAVVAVLPEPLERARKWVADSAIPFPVLADGSKTVADQYDQPLRFGALGSLHDMVGRMPEAVVIDAMGAEPTVAYVHRGSTPGDRPPVDDLLAQIDEVTRE